MRAAAETRGLWFAYGGGAGPALDGVDLDVRAGEVLLLEGPSGGGKSTLLRALCGLVPHFHGGRFAGRVAVGGLDTMRTPPAQLCRAAGMVFQDPEAQSVMGTVERDVAFGLESAGVPAEAIPGRVQRALEEAGAAHLAGRAIATLSGGERQRVALAAALAPAPSVLLLDEPTSQLDAAGAAALAATLRGRARAGVAVVVSEHRADRSRGLADRVLAVREGRLGAPEPADAAGVPHAAGAPGGPRLVVDGLVAGHGGPPVLRGAALEVRAGETVAVHGPNGSGKTTLLRAIAGLHAPDAGRVLVDRRDVTALAAERRFPALSLVPQDPGRHLLTERVRDEVALCLRWLGVPRAERRALVARAMEELDLAELAERHPLDLSVGQRERVALAAALVARPGVILLDEPTRGMDPARRGALADVLRARAAEGAAVLVATHDEGFAARLAGRHLDLRDGTLRERAAAAVAGVA
ncbi:ABC transporter ATP-binding protein [Miltoncostaea marina]|uniref:ABC transporter ATP-binding protein n=1 Tax=Miltoncostaea marina TaxID=2843215 RepID=UPI001C3D1FD6|nr:ABC transporter ATP-binding protein [Miltoncostaea marina]